LRDLSRLSGIFTTVVLDGPKSVSARPRRICTDSVSGAKERFGLAQASLRGKV
jgi:hypothetical protein